MGLAWILASGLSLQDEDWIRRLESTDIEERDRAARRFREISRNLTDALDVFVLLPPTSSERRRLQRVRIRETWRDLLARYLPAPAAFPEPGVLARRQPKGGGLNSMTEDGLEEETLKIRRILKTSRITFEVRDAPLTAVVDHVREVSGLNIHISGIENPDQTFLTVAVQSEPLDSALRRFLRPRGWVHLIKDGVLLIAPVETVGKSVKLELYDVQDLEGEPSGEALVQEIRRRVHPDQWAEAMGQTIQFQNGLLIVRNRLEVHRSVRRFLQEFRVMGALSETRPPRESVRAVFEALDGDASDSAEGRLGELAIQFSNAMIALEEAARHTDLEVRLHAESLLREAIRSLGEPPRRRLLEIEDLHEFVADVRRTWLHVLEPEEVEEAARSLFGIRASAVRLVPAAVRGREPFGDAVSDAVWSGDAVILVEAGTPVEATPERWRRAGAKTLVFTLPQEKGERADGEGPACAVVTLAR